ncbi:CotH kinase family protein [Lachnoclostridium sp. An138]|uniref:CotH kinase family protein n=1 Tax=Lachnoclostridium sp. An138 TaxID=1965560 RepID=UPI0011228926|nr:CotH kinase family protein [Lachnoclostridium sp. An138]
MLNLILLACSLAFLFLWPLWKGPIAFQEGTEEEISRLLATHSQAAEPFFTELAFSGEQLPYDRNTSTFYLPLNMETDIWESGQLTSLASGVSLIFEEDFTGADKQEAIKNGTKFRFYAVRDGEYQECWLTVTGLSVVSIETEADADAEIFGGSAYFWDSSTKVDWTSSSILEANIRGNTSRTYEKKGYKLSLKKQNKNGEIVEDKKSLFGLRNDDEWLLNAMYSDSSKIRDKLSADIWAEIGAYQEEFPEAYFGTRMTYVEVFFNHEYWGLYVLMEPVDSKQLDRTKEGEGGQEEYSYKSVTPQDVSTEELLNQEAYGETLSGFELKGSHTVIDRTSWEPLLSYLELRDLSDDEAFAAAASELTDREGALDIWIYLQAVLGIDNRGKNMYYVAKNRGNRQVVYFAPWDMDITWGDALSEGTGDNVWDVGLFTALYSERINWSFGDRLIELDVDGSCDYVSERWKELRQGVLSDESLTEEIDGLIHQVRDSGALERDAERWPDSNSGQDYELFVRMALYRMKILDYYFDGNLEEYMGLGYE